MPEAAELHDRDAFGKLQGGVEQRWDDLCPLALVSPDSPADEGFRSGPGGGFSAVSRGVADDPAQLLELGYGREQEGEEAVGDRIAPLRCGRQGFGIGGRTVCEECRRVEERVVRKIGSVGECRVGRQGV